VVVLDVLLGAVDAAEPDSLLGALVSPLAAAPVLDVPELSAAIIGVDNVATKTVAARPARMRFIYGVSSWFVPLRNEAGALVTCSQMRAVGHCGYYADANCLIWMLLGKFSASVTQQVNPINVLVLLEYVRQVRKC
jgi:hypothetical protein